MIFPLLFSLVPLTQAILLPPPTGPYKVSLTNTQLIDTTRLDPWSLDTIPNRRLMISKFTPITPKTCQKTLTIPYMTSIVAAAEDEILGPYEWPLGVLGKMEFNVCDSTTSKPLKDAPVVLFSPGGNTTKSYYSAMAMEIASKGYTVITIDHPFETDIVEFPDGTIAYGGHGSTRNATFVEIIVDIRAKDIAFVLDVFGFSREKKGEKAIVFGHSLGGAAAAQAMSEDLRIAGGLNFDGNLWGKVVTTGFNLTYPLRNTKQHFVMFGAELHNTTEDAKWHSFWTALGEQEVWKKELSLKGGAHGAFWDLNLIADVADVRGLFGVYTEEDLVSALNGVRVYSILGEYLDDYFKFVLGVRKSEGLLKGPDSKYPEIEFL